VLTGNHNDMNALAQFPLKCSVLYC